MNEIYSKTSFIVKRKYIAKTLNVILSNSLTYLQADFLDNEDLKITILSSYIPKYKEVFKNNNVNLDFFEEKGLFAKLKSNKYRIGLLIGFFILLISIFLSSKFVWSINISGNETLTDNEIIEELKSSGFGIGSFVPSINYKDLHNKILLSSDKISWISVNIKGNVANVMIKEKNEEIEKENGTFSNIVSMFDGQIVSINVKEGEKQISIGDVVKKGDLLISGVLDSKSQGVRYVNANGEIKAYVKEEIEVKTSFAENKKIYNGKVYTEKRYKIFNKIINFSTKYNNYDSFCDTIETTEQVTLFNRVKLPIFRTIVKYYEYEYQDVLYTKEQTVEIAFKKLRYNLDEKLNNAELISKKITSRFDEDFFYVTCELYYIRDIGTSVEFKVENNGG